MYGRWIQKYRLDICVLIVLLVSIGICVGAYLSIEHSKKHLADFQREYLSTINAGSALTTERWIHRLDVHARQIANEPELLSFIRGKDPLLEPAPDVDTSPEIVVAPQIVARLREHLVGLYEIGIVDRNGTIVAFVRTSAAGSGRENGELCQITLAPEDINAAFFNLQPAIGSISGTGLGNDPRPLFYALAPLQMNQFDAVAFSLVLLVDPSQRLFRYFDSTQFAATGHTYLIDKDRQMLSYGRFEADRGQPLVSTVSLADGLNVEGYKNAQGETVLGSWKWLNHGEFSVVTERHAAEAFAPLAIHVRWLQVGKVLLLVSSILSVALIVLKGRGRNSSSKTTQLPCLGQYHLQKVIGRGGMGTVYLAQHQFLRRRTAVKVIRGHDLSSATIARFEREVMLSCKLRHPNTVSIYDYGNPEDSVFFYAMEYIDGLTLQNLVEQYGPIAESRTILILKQLCNALHEAHSIKLIHRDIKPSNVMITQASGMSDFVKLFDFGLVKGLGDNDKKLTRDNVIAGTPEYVSPEGIEDPQSVDERSDIYTLGAVAYFLLTGQPIFVGGSAIEVCMKRLTTTPKSPSAVLRRAIDPKLEALIMNCLAKAPKDRPQTVRDVKVKLEQCPTARDWSFERAEEWWNAHRASSTQVEMTSPLDTDEFNEIRETDLIPKAVVENVNSDQVSARQKAKPQQEDILEL